MFLIINFITERISHWCATLLSMFVIWCVNYCIILYRSECSIQYVFIMCTTVEKKFLFEDR